jgi:hypothetical protein
VDIISGKPPSTMQIFRMAANPEFREAAKRVATELQNAGIKIDSQVGHSPFQLRPGQTLTHKPSLGSHGRAHEHEKGGLK